MYSWPVLRGRPVVAQRGDDDLLAQRAVRDVLVDLPGHVGDHLTVSRGDGAQAQLHPNPDEVASVHRVALADIAKPNVVDFITIAESDRPVVRVHVNGSTIHAPTAAVIYQFRELLAGRTTRVAELEQPVFAWR